MTLESVKYSLNLSQQDTYEDAKLTALIEAATRYHERRTGQALVDQGYAMYLNHWPRAGEEIQLPIEPLRSVDKFTYWDGTGNADVDPAVYSANLPQGTVSLNPNQSWPSDLQQKTNAIRIEYTAGYGPDTDSVDQWEKHCVTLKIHELYFYPEGMPGNPEMTPYEMAVRGSIRTRMNP